MLDLSIEFWVWMAVSAAALIIIVAQSYTYALQYVYFLRYPVLIALALVVLPLAAFGAADSPLANLFILNRWGLLVTSGAAVFVALSVQFTTGMLWTHLPSRVGLRFLRRDPLGASATHAVLGRTQRPLALHQTPNGLGLLSSLPLRLLVSSLLALPIVAVCVARSVSEKAVGSLVEGSLFALAGALLLGLALALAVFGQRGLAEQSPRVHAAIAGAFALTGRGLDALDRLVFRRRLGPQDFTGYEDKLDDRKPATEQHYPFSHATAAFFTAGSVLLYGAGYFIFHPIEGAGAHLGTLVYVLGLLAVLAWLLPLFTFQFDLYRLPAEIALILVVATIYKWSDLDARYPVVAERPSPTAATPACLYANPGAPCRRRGDPARLVLVAANGGGITAAYWTTLVLTELERRHPGFSERVALISSTSGGSVGALYYVDGFRDGGLPALMLDEVLADAGTSSLSAMGWGLVYPDFLSVAFPPIRRFLTYPDRGRTLEARWAQQLESHGGQATLGDWRRDAVAGLRPAVVFNAIFVETGDRFVLSSLPLAAMPAADPTRPSSRPLRFTKLYDDYDVPIATAARLSATFPWVTPVAQPAIENGHPSAYHAADGGYFDNYGVMSALAFYQQNRDALERIGVGDVLLLEIRASDPGEPPPPSADAFRLATLGPAQAMLRVRDTSQRSRNEFEIGLLEDRICSEGRVALHRASFEMSSGDVPLSWHLSRSDQCAIRCQWDRPSHAPDLEAVARFLGAQGPGAQADGTAGHACQCAFDAEEEQAREAQRRDALRSVRCGRE